MPQTGLANLGLNFEHTLGIDDWKNSYDGNWVITDSVGGQPFVVDHLITAEPGGPAVGDAYILGATQTGANWGSDSGAVPDSIALFTNLPGQVDASPWLYLVPREGWRVYDRTNNAEFFFDGTNWSARGGPQWTSISLGDTTGDFEPTLLEHANAFIVLNTFFDDVNDDINIPDNATQPFNAGTRIRFYNDSNGSVSFLDDAAVQWQDEDLTNITDFAPGSEVEIINIGIDLWGITYVRLVGTHNTDVSGFVADPNINIQYSRVGRIVTLSIPTFTDTSDTTLKSLGTFLPAQLRPLTSRRVFSNAEDNGAGVLTMAVSDVGIDGDIDFFTTLDAGAWTAAGVARVGELQLTYGMG